MDKKVIGGIVAVAVLVIGGYLLFKDNDQPTPSTVNQEQAQPVVQNNTQPVTNGTQVEMEVIKTYEVIYTDSGFSPLSLTVKAGDEVVFKNQSKSGMWVGSAMHPSHIVYSGTSLQKHCPDTVNTSFDECKSAQPSESWSFTFTKKGTWGYHNHVNASKFGKIIVE